MAGLPTGPLYPRPLGPRVAVYRRVLLTAVVQRAMPPGCTGRAGPPPPPRTLHQALPANGKPHPTGLRVIPLAIFRRYAAFAPYGPLPFRAAAQARLLQTWALLSATAARPASATTTCRVLWQRSLRPNKSSSPAVPVNRRPAFQQHDGEHASCERIAPLRLDPPGRLSAFFAPQAGEDRFQRGTGAALHRNSLNRQVTRETPAAAGYDQVPLPQLTNAG